MSEAFRDQGGHGMTNKELIRSAQIVALAVLLACGLWVAGKAAMRMGSQNTNQNQNQNSNQNTNSNQNSNTANANRSQNQNGNRNSRSGGATGDQAGMRNLNSQDRNFMMDAAMGGMLEVELGRLATQQGASDAVKQFGQRMVDDHSQANTELMSIASSKNITLPTELDARHREHVTKLQGMSGAEFDRAYARMMVSDHEKDVSEFERQSTRGMDPDLKAFASKTLPILQEHLQLARTLPGAQRGNSNSNMGGNSNRNRNNNGNSNRP
jgi:putative membrane protein